MAQKIHDTGPTSSEQVLVETSPPASASQLTEGHLLMQAAVGHLHTTTHAQYLRVGKVFNTSYTYGGDVTNIAGDQTVYGLDEKQLGQFPINLYNFIHALTP